MQKSLAQIKATSGRDITSQVDNNTLVYGETGSGTGGAFNFMTPINNALAELTDITSQITAGENVTIQQATKIYKNGKIVIVYVNFITSGLTNGAIIVNNLPRLVTLYFDAPILDHAPDIYKGYVRLNRGEGTMSDIVVEGGTLPEGNYRFSLTYICD